MSGELLLNEGKYDRLIEECLEVLPANSIPWNNSYFLLPVSVDVLARAYIGKKDWDGAIEEYEKMITIDIADPDDRFLIPPAFHSALAKLYEEKMWKGKAIEEYEKFLQIMSSAGVSNPETESARIRLASQKGNT